MLQNDTVNPKYNAISHEQHAQIVNSLLSIVAMGLEAL
jgi:hypothetical protein